MLTDLRRSATRQSLVHQAYRRASALDLEGVRLKLTRQDHGTCWADEDVTAAFNQYWCFLALNFGYPDKAIVPNQTVDEVWHRHILDTRAYARDTQSVFGYFLHHFPYLGTRGPADEEALVQSFAETQRLMALHFPSFNRAAENARAAVCSGDSSCSRCASI